MSNGESGGKLFAPKISQVPNKRIEQKDRKFGQLEKWLALSQKEGGCVNITAKEAFTVLESLLATGNFTCEKHEVDQKINYFLFENESGNNTPFLIYDTEAGKLGTLRNYTFLFYGLKTDVTPEQKKKLFKEMKECADNFGEKPRGQDHPKWNEYLLKVLVETLNQGSIEGLDQNLEKPFEKS